MSDELDQLALQRARGGRRPSERWIWVVLAVIVTANLIAALSGCSVDRNDNRFNGTFVTPGIPPIMLDEALGQNASGNGQEPAG